MTFVKKYWMTLALWLGILAAAAGMAVLSRRPRAVTLADEPDAGDPGPVEVSPPAPPVTTNGSRNGASRSTSTGNLN